MFVDESHMSLPQVRGMYSGDRARKDVLVEHGFRLPSARDNRPLTFSEFENDVLTRSIFVSATPGPYEAEHSTNTVEQVIRPTGLIDPAISVRPTKGQIDDLLGEINQRVARGERVLVTTLTKRMAEDLADYLKESGVRTHYLHSEIDTMERIEILRDLRLGIYDVVVGINLLREGLDLPEVSLVAILDADKEGFLRSEGSLIQTIGRAARHVDGQVIMYADMMTRSMQRRDRRNLSPPRLQVAHNSQHNIQPRGIIKEIRDLTERVRRLPRNRRSTGRMAAGQRRHHRRDPEGRIGPDGQGPRVPDEDGGQGPGVRESRADPRPNCRTAPHHRVRSGPELDSLVSP